MYICSGCHILRVEERIPESQASNSHLRCILLCSQLIGMALRLVRREARCICWHQERKQNGGQISTKT